MLKKEILSYIEDNNIEPDNSWYFHATSNDIETIRKILNEGIKSAHLRGEKGNHFNGKYYISLYKYDNASEGLITWLINHPKIIVQDIEPCYADRSKYKLRRFFINTRIPLRTSEWDGEFQQYLKVESSRFVGIEYSLSSILANTNDSHIKEKIEFLQNMILCMEQVNKNLPIYDLSSKHEINKQKTLSLNL